MSADKQWDHSTELLVVGSGAGGMTAAILAKDFGSDALVIEKSDLYGGTTAVSGGNIWVPCNPQMEALNYSDTPEEAMDYLKNTVGDDTPEEKLQAYIETGSGLVRYLEEKTPIRFVAGPLPDYYSALPGGKDKYRALDPAPLSARALGETIHKLRPPHPLTIVAGVSFTTGEIATILTKKPGWLRTVLTLMVKQSLDITWRLKSKLPRRLTLGNALVARCLLALEERQIPIWLQTALKELIIEDGRVVGALVLKEGREMRIEAKRGVVIAAGGFSHNAEMRAHYLPHSPETAWSVTPQENTGDGIQAGMKTGAQTALMEEAWWIPVFQMPLSQVTGGMFMERSFPGSIIVDQEGKRYLNEAANYDHAGRDMVQASRDGKPIAPSYFIFDGRFRSNYNAGPLKPMPSFLDAFLSKDAKKLIIKASNLTKLAKKIGTDPKTLEETVRTHNDYSKSGIDADFNRGAEPYEHHYSDPNIGPNSTLAPIETAPFYALPIYPGDIGTKGGLLTDKDARVLNAKGNPISGLYAIGNSSASIMGRSYPGGGATIGPAMVFGARAAMAATGKSLLK